MSYLKALAFQPLLAQCTLIEAQKPLYSSRVTNLQITTLESQQVEMRAMAYALWAVTDINKNLTRYDYKQKQLFILSQHFNILKFTSSLSFVRVMKTPKWEEMWGIMLIHNVYLVDKLGTQVPPLLWQSAHYVITCIKIDRGFGLMLPRSVFKSPHLFPQLFYLYLQRSSKLFLSKGWHNNILNVATKKQVKTLKVCFSRSKVLLKRIRTCNAAMHQLTSFERLADKRFISSEHSYAMSLKISDDRQDSDFCSNRKSSSSCVSFFTSTATFLSLASTSSCEKWQSGMSAKHYILLCGTQLYNSGDI